jgi:nucleoside-diphosphate-sugar epimerase
VKILFTGGSSFTGHWFITELARAGHEVVATFRSPRDGYSDVRKTRVDSLVTICRPVFQCSFGSERFFEQVEAGEHWDALCHHAAETADYKSPDFDTLAAVESNTRGVEAALTALARRGCRRLVITGSVFENDEGAGSEELPAFSPYGLSKALTAQIFRYHAGIRELRLGKFVIPNPFGPLEEPRFTSYLARSWYEGKTPVVNTPVYVRDNIHVSLLSKAYRQFVEKLGTGHGLEKIGPSGYVESQGAFAGRLAAAMSPRLGIPCPLELCEQEEFPEPRVRINTDVLDADELGWNETEAWDELGEYYRATFA